MNREKGTGNTIERSNFQLWYEIRLLLLGRKDDRERALEALQDPELKDPAAATKDSESSPIWGYYDRRRTMMCWRRRLFTSKRGFIGLGPDSAQPQDKILILKGCSMPVVARPREEHYELIGGCYVQGIMHGEAMDRLEE